MQKKHTLGNRINSPFTFIYHALCVFTFGADLLVVTIIAALLLLLLIQCALPNNGFLNARGALEKIKSDRFCCPLFLAVFISIIRIHCVYSILRNFIAFNERKMLSICHFSLVWWFRKWIYSIQWCISSWKLKIRKNPVIHNFRRFSLTIK